MLKSFTLRILISVLAASFLSIGFTVFYGMRAMEKAQALDVRDRMISEASLAAEMFRLGGESGEKVYAWFAANKYADMRVTIVGSDGAVQYDSSASSGTELDNHADRPEIIEAMKQGAGYASRSSGTLETDYVYAAARMDDGRLLRLAVPLAQVRHVMWSRNELLMQTGVLAALLSVLFALLVSVSTKNSFQPMIRVVEDIAAGHLRRRVRKYPGTEFAPLAEAVNTMAQSIEEQVRAQADQTAQLETILNTMSDGVLVLGQRGHIRRCNKALERSFPAIGDARGRQVVEIIPSPALQNAVEEMLKDCDASRPGAGGPQTVSLHIGLQNGRVFSVLLTRPQHPEPRLGMVAVFHDVTDIMHLERVRKDFVANVSHELRTPLTAITGYAETMLAVEDVAQCHKFADVVLRNARGLERMTRDLLELARLEREDTGIELEAVSPLACAEESARVCTAAFQARGLKMACDIPGECLVMADMSLLSQVFRNLLENASRYAEEGSTVRISSKVSGSQVLMRVHNDGPVIPQADIERIFERFYSVERHRGQGSTGLGLAICRH
ncbi:MAG: histidine kinase dimerization/phospho-acceptor domain-containing protein, partial [Desulfovibrionaceae bacterium]|nr:histidine kinase dimerization/phospho-acceptor domain-containing protein [Desulfovibrionaceae bacterium]